MAPEWILELHGKAYLKQIHLLGFRLPESRVPVVEPPSHPGAVSIFEVFLKQRPETVVVQGRGGMEQRKQPKVL